MKFLAVRNWQKFQHYRDRNPQWIKLYGELLDDHNFLSLPEPAQAQLMKLWILASRRNNRLPADARTLKVLIGASGKLHLSALIDGGWLVDADALEESDQEADRERWASRYVAQDVREALLAEAGYRCVWCESTERLEIDHKIPISRGGTGDRDNLQVLCRSCNRKKRQRTSAEHVATQNAEACSADAPQMAGQNAAQKAPQVGGDLRSASRASARSREGETETEGEAPPPAREGSPQVERFLGGMSPSQRESWEHLLAGWREGMGYPGGRAAQQEDIDVGVMEYLALVDERQRDYSPRHVVQFVESARVRRVTAPSREGRARASDESTAEQAMRVATALGTLAGGHAA